MTESHDDAPQRRFRMRDLFRLALWGIVAAGALTLATFTASSDAGTDRLLFAIAQLQAGPGPSKLATYESETAQLVEAVRALAADRDRLLTRLAALERNLDDVTGSLGRAAEKGSAGAPAQAGVNWPEPGGTVPTTIPPPRPATAPQAPAGDPSVTKTEFGVDLGGASAIEGLRALWMAVYSRHGNLLQGLRPVVSMRESTRPGGVELRLVVGPLSNAAAAARLCGALVGGGAACQPAVFDGQRLALR